MKFYYSWHFLEQIYVKRIFSLDYIACCIQYRRDISTTIELIGLRIYVYY